MRKLGLLFILLLGLCSAGWTQLPKWRPHASRGKSHVSRTHYLNATQTPTISVIGYYHRLGNGEKFSVPEWAREKGVTRQIRSSVYKRSRESLLLEAQKLGLAPQYWNTYANEELEEFILSVKSFTNFARQKVSARCDFTATNMKEFIKLQNWANTQPDYFPENYLRDFMDSHKSYEESWNSAVKSLRILVVNDQMRNVNYLISAAEENPLVTVKWATSVREALELLEKKPYDYDVVLTDWVMYDEDRSVAEVSMHIYNERLTIPVILYSAANLSPAALLRFNIVGRVEIPTPWIPGLGVEPIFNYLSNIVATGRAFPNN